MKKLLLTLLLFPTLALSQADLSVSVLWRDLSGFNINQNNKAVVGDTIRADYLFSALATGIKYVTFDGQYNNDHLTPVPNSFEFNLGNMNDTQVFAERYVYDNKVWDQNTPSDCYDIQSERNYWLSGKGYSDNQMFSIERIAIQASSGDISSLDLVVFATQKFIVKEPTVTAGGDYAITLGEAEDANGDSIGVFQPAACTFEVLAQMPTEYQLVFEVVLPQAVNPTEMYISLEATGNLQIGSENITQGGKYLDIDGKVTLQNVTLDETYFINPTPIGASHIDDIITVTDAYRAFKALNDVGIDGNNKILDAWEEFIVDVNLNGEFDSQDVNLLLSKVIGQPGDACLPYVLDGTTELGCYASILYEDYRLDVINPTTDQVFVSLPQTVFTSTEAASTTIKNQQIAFWQHGDIDFSHSTPYPYTSNATSKAFNQSSKVANSANINLVSRIEGDKVLVDLDLVTGGLAGLQSKIDYDTSVLTLEEVRFNTGNTVTNFNKVVGNKVVFGSISLEGESVKRGEAYTLVFSMKQNVTNTTGLFYFYNTDAVSQSGEKLRLNIQ